MPKEIIIGSNNLKQPLYNDINFLKKQKIALYNLIGLTVILPKGITNEIKDKVKNIIVGCNDDLNRLNIIYSGCNGIEDMKKKFEEIKKLYLDIQQLLRDLIIIVSSYIQGEERECFLKDPGPFRSVNDIQKLVSSYFLERNLKRIHELNFNIPSNKNGLHGMLLDEKGDIATASINHDPNHLCKGCHQDNRSNDGHTCFKQIYINEIQNYAERINFEQMVQDFLTEKLSLIKEIQEDLQNLYDTKLNIFK